jgi:hypothetical protein
MQASRNNSSYNKPDEINLATSLPDVGSKMVLANDVSDEVFGNAASERVLGNVTYSVYRLTPALE